MSSNFLHGNKCFSTEFSETVKDENALLNKAILFAVEHHAGAVRKASPHPYIIHPLETMQILFSMKADMPLLIAGVLHDTVEDTDATIEEIIELFGPEIGRLVSSHTENKELSWAERKQHTITELKTASFQTKMLVLADKVSNLRSMLSDYREIGDELWNHFNAPKEKQAWYYSSIQDALYDLQDYPETEAVYWEMVGLYKDIFVTQFLDEENQVLYQVAASGEAYCLASNNPQWLPVIGELPNTLIRLPRRESEYLEDRWTDDFWNSRPTDSNTHKYGEYTSEPPIPYPHS